MFIYLSLKDSITFIKGGSMTKKERKDNVTVPVRIKGNSFKRYKILAGLEGKKSANYKMAEVLEEFIRNWKGALPLDKPTELTAEDVNAAPKQEPQSASD